MKRVYLVSLDFLENSRLDSKVKSTFIVDFLLNQSAKNYVCAFSRNKDRLLKVKNKFPITDKRFLFATRKEVDSILAENLINNDFSFIVIGRKNQDFYTAVNNKIILITPTWLDFVEDKPKQYGIKIETTQQFKVFIETLTNQSSWYSKLTLPDSTIILSLSDGRSRYAFPNSEEERFVIEEFNRILKKNNGNYYEMYLYHFLASISNNRELFRDIDYWGFIPSSSGHVDNNEMFVFKERVREIMKGQALRQDSDYNIYKNLLARHTPTSKSHLTPKCIRINEGSSKHFDTIRLTKGYKGKLKDKNICIFDDYLTHGNSFECARNLLRNVGVNKLIFVTLGRFENPYQFQEYKLTGDIYSNDYEYELIRKEELQKSQFEMNLASKNEVANLYDIFNISSK